MPKLDPEAQTERRINPTVHSETSLPIYWLNEEWAVTRFGLECVAPGSSYYIAAKSLALVRGNRAEWPAQVETKGWTDPRLFVEAFFKALEIHEVKHSFDRQQEEMLARKAADEMVAWNEARRRRVKKSGNVSGVTTIAEMTESEEEMESLLAEGYVAPEFPQSCVGR